MSEDEIQNYSKYLGEIIPFLIIRKGSGSKNYTYKLTFPGIERASKLLVKIINESLLD